MRTVSVILWLAALGAAAPVGAVVANLDGDPRQESVREVASASGRRIVLEDRCGSEPVRSRLSGTHDLVERLRVRGVDGFGERPEIVFELRSGAGGHVGLTAVVRYGERGEAGCVGPRRLFHYRPDAPPLEPPAGYAPSDWRVGIRNVARFRGKEIRLREAYVDRDDPLCCPSKQRVTHFRFDPDRDRYVVYRTRISDVD